MLPEKDFYELPDIDLYAVVLWTEEYLTHISNIKDNEDTYTDLGNCIHYDYCSFRDYLEIVNLTPYYREYLEFEINELLQNSTYYHTLSKAFMSKLQLSFLNLIVNYIHERKDGYGYRKERPYFEVKIDDNQFKILYNITMCIGEDRYKVDYVSTDSSEDQILEFRLSKYNKNTDTFEDLDYVPVGDESYIYTLVGAQKYFEQQIIENKYSKRA